MKLFVWDFHGTLEKGTEGAVVEITNRVLRSRGYYEHTDEDLVASIGYLYGKKWYEIFAHLLPREPRATHLQLQEDCFLFEERNPDIIPRHIRTNNFAKEVLSRIQEHHDQILISNTRPSALEVFLRAADLKEFFPAGKYFAANAHHPDAQLSKQEIADHYIAGKKFDAIVSIGDSAGDMIFAENAVTYLYAHPGAPHRECAADYRIEDLREALREC